MKQEILMVDVMNTIKRIMMGFMGKGNAPFLKPRKLRSDFYQIDLFFIKIFTFASTLLNRKFGQL